MSKFFLPFISVFVFSLTASFAQGVMDFVKEVRGDTLVVKDYTDMGRQENSLNNVISNDTDAPEGRVYELQYGGWYPQSVPFTTPADRPVIIAGAGTKPLVNRTTVSEQPPINSEDLLTAQVDLLKEFNLSTVDTLSTVILPDWRVVNKGGVDDFIYTDFPVPVNLAYTNADLVAAGTDGLPVGDLNWFPAAKAGFMKNYSVYHSALITAWNSGTKVLSVKEPGGVVSKYSLSQNYPNPFNPTTTISFSIPEASNVTLIVYNALGKEVAVLVDGYKPAQSYQVDFDASALSSVVYFYTLKTAEFTETHKMVLMK